MKLAIMQPYLFPYLGYFQLMYAVDEFVFYDDVNFIKRGWVNRNRILQNNSDLLFTLPVENASQNSLINEVTILHDLKWEKKFLNTLVHSYRKAPYFNSSFSIIQQCLPTFSGPLVDIIFQSCNKICDYLGMEVNFSCSSLKYSDTKVYSGQNRILRICEAASASMYINPIGGRELYDKTVFKSSSIDLKFLRMGDIKYNQFREPFVPGLSIIDVMMFNSPEEIRKMLKDYTLEC